MNLSERQVCILWHLLSHHSVSCNGAGDRLDKHRLLKRSGEKCSNRCLAGSAVLRSLERRGLVVMFHSSSDQWAVKLYSLTDSGRKAAQAMETAP